MRLDARLVLRHRGTAVVAIALGVVLGVASAMVAAVDALVLRPLGVPAADRIVHLGNMAHPLVGDPVEYWGQAGSLAALATYETGLVEVRLDGHRREVRTTAVSAAFFSVFGVVPLPGRAFSVEEDRSNEPVAVVGAAFRDRHFGPGAAVLGAQILLEGTLHRVVGVAPAGFDFPGGTEIWTPRTRAGGRARGNDDPFGLVRRDGWVGRLRPETSIESARSELGGLLHGLHALYTRSTGVRFGERVFVRPMVDVARERVIAPALLLLALSGLLLGTAVASLGTLLLGRMSVRRVEFAVRQALGATRRNLLLQLGSETFSLALGVGVVGALVASLSIVGGREIFAAWWVHQPPLERLVAVASGAALGLAFPSVLLASAGAMAVALRAAPSEGLRDGGGASTGQVRWTRRLLVISQTVIAVVLLNGALVSAWTLRAALEIPLGYESKNLLLGRLGASPQALMAEVAQLPGVSAAATASAPPGVASAGGVWIDGEAGRVLCQVWHVEGDFLAATGIRLLAGRAFAPGDADVLILAFADEGRRPGQAVAAVGRQIRIEGELALREIIGVVAPVRGIYAAQEPLPQCYLPRSRPARGRHPDEEWLLVRCHDCGEAARQIHAVSGTTMSPSVHGLVFAGDLVARAQAPLLAQVRLLGTYALVGLGAALVGVSAVVYSLAAMRRFEMAVRAVVGAGPRELTILMAAEGATLVMAGIGIGTLVSVWLGQWAESAHFRWASFELATLTASAAFTLLCAAAASLAPALAASRQAPLETLRRP